MRIPFEAGGRYPRMAYVLFGGPVSASPDHALSAISAGANEADRRCRQS